MLFVKTPVFEHGCFSLITESLEKRHYFTIGRAVSRSILFGHPGPSCLNTYIVEFILHGREPDSNHLKVEQLSHRKDIISAINKVLKIIYTYLFLGIKLQLLFYLLSIAFLGHLSHSGDLLLYVYVNIFSFFSETVDPI